MLENQGGNAHKLSCAKLTVQFIEWLFCCWLCRFGQFVVSLLPPYSAIERHLNLEAEDEESLSPESLCEFMFVHFYNYH